MFYIVGLGNPGVQYEQNRHNVGWMVLDAFVAHSKLPQPVSSKKYAGAVSEGVVGETDVTVLYPHTYMNKSGSAVQKLVPRKEVSQLVVIYDDIDLPLGQVRIAFSRGSGGHNGVQSIIDTLGSKDFIRIRIGIAKRGFFSTKAKRPSGERLNKHVMGDFSTKELLIVDEAISHAVDALQSIIRNGKEMAMNRYNV